MKPRQQRLTLKGLRQRLFRTKYGYDVKFDRDFANNCVEQYFKVYPSERKYYETQTHNSKSNNRQRTR